LIHTSESLKAIFASVTKDGYANAPTTPSHVPTGHRCCVSHSV
jgi:hypothetical protein